MLGRTVACGSVPSVDSLVVHLSGVEHSLQDRQGYFVCLTCSPSSILPWRLKTMKSPWSCGTIPVSVEHVHWTEATACAGGDHRLPH